jgi:hypothetical protein
MLQSSLEVLDTGPQTTLVLADVLFLLRMITEVIMDYPESSRQDKVILIL